LATESTCFSADSQVKMLDGAYESIAKIKPGVRVLAPTASVIVTMLDSHTSQEGK